MAHDVFICYSSKDSELAMTACATLERAGFQCWIAPRDPVPGIPYGRQIIDAIGTAQVVMLVLSSHANESEHVVRELELASETGKIVVPLRVENVLPSGDLRYYITAVHWLDAIAPHTDQQWQHLVELMQRLTSKGSEEPIAAPAPRRPVATSPPVRKLPWWRSPVTIGGAILAIVLVAAGFVLVNRPQAQPEDSAASAVAHYYALWNAKNYQAMYGMLTPGYRAAHPYAGWLAEHASTDRISVKTQPGSSPDVVDVRIHSLDRDNAGNVSASDYAGSWHLTHGADGWQLDSPTLEKT